MRTRAPSSSRSRHSRLWCARGLFAAAITLTTSIGHAAADGSAIATFPRLQQHLVDDKKAGDWNAFLSDARQLKVFLNDSPTSGLEIARALLQLGQPEAARVEVQRFTGMGQTNAILDAPLFAPLRPSIEAQLRHNRTPIATAKPIFELDDPAIVPEDIDYDPHAKRFFVSSVLQHRIVAFDTAGHSQAFADPPEPWPVLALKIDTKRRRLWATEVALDGFSAVAKADWGRSALLEYDLDRAVLLARHEGPAGSNLGDMTLARNGDPIVADGTGGGLYRWHDGAFRRLDRGDFISPQTVAFCADERHALVPDYVRGLALFDLTTGAVRWLATQDRYALDGMDGLYCRGDDLIALQNGTAPERVIVFALDPSHRKVSAEHVIERSTPTLGVPTHGVWVGATFFYIANSGWNALDEHGGVVPAAHMSKAVIMQIDAAALARDARAQVH